MKAVLQRVSHASVSVQGQALAQIGHGLVVLVGIREGDTDETAAWMAGKVANLRIFEDDAGKFNRSLLDVGGEALIVSQFTLYGNARKGRRPSFTDAAHPDIAAPLVDTFAEYLRQNGVAGVSTGRFQAHMMVEIHNDGPVTIILDSEVSRRGNPRESLP